MEQFLGGLQVLLQWQNFLIIPVGLAIRRVQPNGSSAQKRCARSSSASWHSWAYW